MFKLTDQIALVTGGANGIGAGIASVLAKAGANVIIADIDKTNGPKVAQSLNGVFMELDVTKQDQVDRVITEICDRFGRLDILCSNTGIFPQALLEDMTEENWDQMQLINLKSMFFVVKAALNAMKKQNYGRVIITSSITGPVTGYPGWSHYGATKAGQLGFMRSVALEYAPYGITVNAVQPGNILTAGLEAQGEVYLKQQRAIIPTHILGKPDDIGYAACFLASKEASFITGQSIIIDGGQILPESQDAIL